MAKDSQPTNQTEESTKNSRADVFREKGNRIEEEISEEFKDYQSSKKVLEMVEGLHAFDKAHTVMLTEQSIIPNKDGRLILEGLREMESVGVMQVRKDMGAHLHTGEAYLTELLGEEVAGKMHAGRSSGDLGKVAGRYAARNRLIGIIEELNILRESLIEKADNHTSTVMPGYSHMQHAQPTSLGHYLMSFEHAFERDFNRLVQAYDTTNISPAGSAILSGTQYPIDRDRTRELLGFKDLHKNTMDAIFNSDWGLEIHSSLMILYSSISKLAEDLTLFGTHEYNLIEYPGEFCGTSSIMPQKKNPNLTQYIVGETGKIYGDSLNAFITNKGSNGRLDVMLGGYSNLWDSLDICKTILSLFGEFIQNMGVNEDEMAKKTRENWSQATDLADTLVLKKGLPFRTAHQIIANLVRISNERDIPPMDITPELLDEASMLVTEENVGIDKDTLQSVLEPSSCIQARDLIGGPAPNRVSKDIKRGKSKLQSDAEVCTEMKAALSKSANKLEESIDEIIE